MPLLILLLSLALATPALGKVYRWVDEDGNVHYGDRIPPEYAQQKRQELNERGIVVDETNRPPTEEELKAQREKLQAEEAAKRQRAEQERYDQFLLSTYATQDQLLLRRDEQLGILDGQIAAAKKSLSQSKETLANLEQRAEGKDKIPDKLEGQLQHWQRQVAESSAALAKMEAKREKVAAEFERDLQRYLQLTAE